MSSISRWSYTNTATVWKRGKKNHLEGGSPWGVPYTIKCTWTAGTEVMKTESGAEFVSTCQYFHEDARPGHGDRIKRGIHDAADPMTLGGTEEIKSHTEWDMTPFGSNELPDYRSAV